MTRIDDEKVAYGSFALRFLAWLFDVFLIWLVPLIFFFIVVATASETAYVWRGLLWTVWLVVFVQWLIMLFYRIYTYLHFRASVGKILAGLEIRKEDGSQPTLGDALLRFPIGYAVSSLLWGLGFFWILRDNKRRAFHDLIAGTVVVKKGSASQLYLLLPILIVTYLAIFYLLNTLATDQGLWQGLANDLSLFWQNLQEAVKG